MFHTGKLHTYRYLKSYTKIQRDLLSNSEYLMSGGDAAVDANRHPRAFSGPCSLSDPWAEPAARMPGSIR